jgi:large subunit ribosomal protein LP0
MSGAPAPVVKKVKVLKEVVKVDPMIKKKAYFERLTKCLQTYSKIAIVTIDNVGANHLARVRKQYRGTAEVVMGKNTLMRRCVRKYIEDGHPEFENLLTVLRGNVGLVFTNGDLRTVRNDVTSYRVPAPAKAGIIAPSDVLIPAGPTGLEPTATAFLQALNIPSKIVKGQVELTGVVHLIAKGDKVKPGAAALLQKLKITPFTYGIDVNLVFNNGFVYGANLLDMTDRDVLAKFAAGLNNIASLGFAIGYPTLANVPHIIVNSYKNLLSIGVQTEYSFGPVDDLKERIKNPGAFASAAPAAAAAAPVAVAAPVVEEEESDDEMELDLFG